MKKVKELFEKAKKKTVQIYNKAKEWVIVHKTVSVIVASVLAVGAILAIVIPLAI